MGTPEIVAVVCFFLSGFAGLVYEVCWIRKASLVFGSTTFAVSTVLAVFFLGLAAGSYLFGRIGQRSAHPLRLYAWMEIALAALSVLSLYAFDLADVLYGGLYRSLAGSAVGLAAVRVAVVSLILLPPSVLMGGTLPLFCRFFVRDRATITRSVGWLYGVNTLGAAAGTATAGLVLLPTLGLWGALLVGAAASLVCGIAVLALRVSPLPAADAPARIDSPDRREPRVIALLFFAVGFVALGGEVLWTRFLALVVRNTVYTYTLTLTVVLVGIVLGSVVASWIFRRSRTVALVFAVLQILGGLSVLALMTLPPHVWRRFDSELWVYFLALLPAAVLSGASFPLATGMVVRDPGQSSRGVGRMAAINTLGGILGSLLIGFLGIPLFGIETSLLFVTAVSLIAGFVALIVLVEAPTLTRGAVIAIAALAWFAIPRVQGTRLPLDFLGDRDAVVDFREGFGSNLAVLREGDVLQLEIDRWWQGVNKKTQQFMAAHIPMLLHPGPERVLVVGVGVGQTANRFLMYDVEKLDCVDIEPTIFDFVKRNFDSAWMDDPRVSLIEEDGRNYLSHTGATYDVISLEVGQLVRPGIAFFYTRDFYERARERLAAGGLLSQFVPLSFLSADHLRGVIRSFLDVFPQSMLWYNRAELLLIGVNADGVEVGPRIAERLVSSREIHRDLAYDYWGGPRYSLNEPRVLLAGYLMGPEGLARMSAGGATYTDSLPVLDYEVSHVERPLVEELAGVDTLRGSVEPLDALLALPRDRLAAIEAIREKNLGELGASAFIRRAARFKSSGDAARAEELLLQALRHNPEHADGNLMLADVLSETGRPEDAGRYYLAALSLRPDNARAHTRVAQILFAMNRVDQAIQHFRAVVRLTPEDADAHNNLGLALATRFDYREAAHHLEAALRLRPGDAAIEENLAMVRGVLDSSGGPD